MKKTGKSFWIVVFLVAWLGMIFLFSAQPWSNSFHTSSTVEKTILSFAGQIAGGEAAAEKLLEYFPVRKIAHFTEYLILGVLSMTGIWLYRKEHSKTGRGSFFPAMGFCVLFAALDELHQAFVPGRTSSLWDVALDSIGAFTGIVLSAWMIKRREKDNKRS